MLTHFLPGLLLHAVIVALGTACGLGGVYLFAAAGLAGAIFACGQLRTRMSIMFLPLLVIPSLLAFQGVITALEVFIPIMGRAGSTVISDVFIGVLVGILTGLVSMVPISLVPAIRHRHKLAMLLAAVSLVAIFVALDISAYTPERPKRIFIQHVHREFVDLFPVLPGDFSENRAASTVTAHRSESRSTDPGLNASAVFLLAVDEVGYSPLSSLTKKFPGTHTVSCRPGSVSQAPECAFPWYFPLQSFVHEFMVIPSPPPPASLFPLPELQARQVFNSADAGTRTLVLNITGSDHMGLLIHPGQQSIVAWSLTDPVPPRTFGEYFVFYSSGTRGRQSWTLTLEVLGQDPVVVSVVAHYFRPRTAPVQLVRSEFPPWVTPIDWVSTLVQYRVH
jgi:hypothetical protein